MLFKYRINFVVPVSVDWYASYCRLGLGIEANEVRGFGKAKRQGRVKM
jgi:hypothetical protein